MSFFIVVRQKSDLTEAKKGKRLPPSYFILEQDKWDDYGYKTSFYLKYQPVKGEIKEIGSLKIMARAMVEGYTELKDTFKKLGVDFCSLGMDRSYYETLAKLFEEDVAREVLASLRDCALDATIRSNFSGEEAFKTSLVRTGEAEKLANEARSIFNQGEQEVRSTDFSFRFSYCFPRQRTDQILHFDFKRTALLPFRTNVIIGRNGTGKTSLLGLLPRVYIGDRLESNKIESSKSAALTGQFVDGRKPGFSKVIAVSFSPFDSFSLPKIKGNSNEARKVRKDKGFYLGYKYIGIRMVEGSGATERLKSGNELRIEFEESLDSIIAEGNVTQFNEVVADVLNDASFGDFDFDVRIGAYSDVGNLKSAFVDSFGELSSGQRAILLVLTSLYANCDPESLILLDEPENHLHPSLLTRFVKSLNKLLKVKDSYAIIGTHSPIVLQETPARYVKILDRSRDPAAPRLECYGEDLSTIVAETFGVNSEDTGYMETLEKISQQNRSKVDLEQLFQRKLTLTMSSYIRSDDDV